MNIVEQKAEKLAAKLSVNEMAIDDLDSQIKELQRRKKELQNDTELFKDDLRAGMASSGITRIENKEHGILFRLDPPTKRVEIENEIDIPDKFFKIERKLDKTAIKKAIEVGDEVPGASIVEGKNRLTIKV